MFCNVHLAKLKTETVPMFVVVLLLANAVDEIICQWTSEYGP